MRLNAFASALGIVSASLFLIVATAEEARAWNTGLVSITNTFPRPVDVIDREAGGDDPGNIGVNESNPKIKLTMPWCDNTGEVLKKAVIFLDNGPNPTSPSATSTVLFFLCQNYRDDTVYFVPGNGVLLGSVST